MDHATFYNANDKNNNKRKYNICNIICKSLSNS